MEELKKVQNQNRVLNIAVADKATAKKWKNITMTWKEIIEKLEEPIVTDETVEEYKAMSTSEKGRIKDVGGFVGGFLKNGSRKRGDVQSRSIVALDIDYPTEDLIDSLWILMPYEAALYSTHSHYEGHERYRLLLPLSRPILPDEYEAVARKLAEELGIEMFDDTTYQPNRLMYWASCPKEGEYVFEQFEGVLVDPDEILAKYEDWKDVSTWPHSSRVTAKVKRDLSVEDPTEKEGIVGTFCRAYSISEAIDTFLSDTYTECDMLKSRYTYVLGSTYGGAVAYEDKFLYSHHSTDPTCEQLCNAFDLVRIHKFGELDKNTKKEGVELPSYQKMVEFIQKDNEFNRQLAEDIARDDRRLREEFENFDDVDNLEKPSEPIYELTEKGKIKSTVENIVIFIESRLKDTIYYDSFSCRCMTTGKLPWSKGRGLSEWRDTDDSALRNLIEKRLGIFSKPKVEDAIKIVFERHKKHHVREYLDSLKWDGVERVDTLLIDYLGAEDIPYNRYTIRKVMAALVARVYKPGIKFDNMLVLTGAQGLGKSTFLNTLGGDWYSDSLTTVSGKEAFEQLQGVWLVEMGELTATKKADIESIKHFLSKQEDRYRQAYGRRTENYPRQCVIVGTTNDTEFLRDRTGNRRFWPIDVGRIKAKKNVWVDLEKERDQILAEAIEIFKNGERLYLDREQNEEATLAQLNHTESSEREGAVLAYLDKMIPDNWDKLDMFTRRMYYSREDGVESGFDFEKANLVQRDTVCAMSIWCELYGKDMASLKNVDAREFRAIIESSGEWEPCRTSFSIYGRQRGYKRKC